MKPMFPIFSILHVFLQVPEIKKKDALDILDVPRIQFPVDYNTSNTQTYVI